MVRAAVTSIVAGKGASCVLSGIFFLLPFTVRSSYGQSALSTMRGTVTDQTNAVVPGVEVTVTDVKTNVRVRTVVTDESGNYEVPEVHPGTYQVRAEIAGFKSFVADDVILEGKQIRRIDIVLQIGQVSEQVTVEAGTAAITTDTAEISSAFKSTLYDKTPLVRNYYPHSLMTTLAGVESQASGWNLRINGQPPPQVALGMDGVTNDGTVNLINRMDFSELTVTGVNNKADQSRVANYNMVSKKGDNQFRGSFYYTHFNSALNARQFFDPRKTVEKEHRSQLVMSGPILKDRTFFYASYFYLDLPAGSFRRDNVPTLRMRQGDFSQVGRPVNDPLTGQPFPNNTIPAARINPTALKIQELYFPSPNLGTPETPVSNFGFLHPYPSDLFAAHYPMVRIDHNISKNNSIYGRYIRRYTPYVLASALPAFAWTRVRKHAGWVVNDTHVFSPNLVNSFRFGLKTDFIEDGLEVSGVTPPRADQVIQQIGLQGVNQRGYQVQGSPRINITGLASIGISGGGIIGDDYQSSYAESITWSKGRHVYKFGGELKRASVFGGQIPETTFGRFEYNGSLTGHPYADFLLGLPFSSERLDPFTNRTRIAYEFGVYAMDTFKVSQRLSLDYGLRWDYFTAPRFKDGRQYAWDPRTGNVIVPQDALSAVSPLYPKNVTVVAGDVTPESTMKNFRPRLGFAYRLRGTTVVRGGYGIFTEQIGYFTRVQGGGPFQISETYFNSIVNGQPLFAFPNPFPGSLASVTVASQSINAFPPRMRNGSVHQFNLSVEQQVHDLGFRASYIGSRSRGLNYAMSINKPRPSLIPFTASRRPYPQFVNVIMDQDNGANNYNALQFEAQRKAGLVTFDGHYTLQSNVSNFLNLENPYNPNLWNREAFSARHRAVFSTMIELPWGRGRRFLSGASPLVSQIVGGWDLVTVSYFQSGQFFSPSFSGADPSNTNTTSGLPDRMADGNLPRSQRTVERWFDPSAFVVPAPGRFGNSGVNVLERPGLHLHHLSVTKRFFLGERFKLEYTLGISNLFNHAHFSPPISNISVPRTGQITTILVGADLSMEKTRAREIEMTLFLRW